MNIENKKDQLVQHRKEQILAAAKHIFAQNGFRRTRIDEIAVHLNVGKGTLYRYFKDKKSLFLAVFEQGIGQLQQTMRQKVEPINDPRHKIMEAVRNYFEFFEKDRELIEIMMQVRSEFKEEYRQIFVATYGDYIVKIQENLRTGISKGVFRDLDITRTAEAISATLQGVLQSFYIRELGSESTFEQPKGSLADRTSAVTALLLEGLLKRDSQQSV